MAYRYRRRRAYRKRRYYSRSRFARKLARSLNQKDTCRLIISSRPEQIELTYNKQTSGATMSFSGGYTYVMVYNPIVRLMGNDVHEPLTGFSKFKELFDQFKINAIRMKIQCMSQPTPSQNIAAVIRTAIDRNGIAEAFQEQIAAQNPSNSDTILAASSSLESYSSFNTKLVNISDLYSLYKTFYPSYREKGLWLGCSQKLKGDDSVCNQPDITMPFRPILILQWYISGLTEGGGKSVVYNISYDYDITFKGQRNIS